MVSFDNVASAVMTVIQVVTLQGWSGIMDTCQVRVFVFVWVCVCVWHGYMS